MLSIGYEITERSFLAHSRSAAVSAGTPQLNNRMSLLGYPLGNAYLVLGSAGKVQIFVIILT